MIHAPQRLIIRYHQEVASMGILVSFVSAVAQTTTELLVLLGDQLLAAATTVVLIIISVIGGALGSDK